MRRAIAVSVLIFSSVALAQAPVQVVAVATTPTVGASCPTGYSAVVMGLDGGGFRKCSAGLWERTGVKLAYSGDTYSFYTTSGAAVPFTATLHSVTLGSGHSGGYGYYGAQGAAYVACNMNSSGDCAVGVTMGTSDAHPNGPEYTFTRASLLRVSQNAADGDWTLGSDGSVTIKADADNDGSGTKVIYFNASGDGGSEASIDANGTVFTPLLSLRNGAFGLSIFPPTLGASIQQYTQNVNGDYFVYRTTADTLTNKTIDTAGPNTLKISGNPIVGSGSSAGNITFQDPGAGGKTVAWTTDIPAAKTCTGVITGGGDPNESATRYFAFGGIGSVSDADASVNLWRAPVAATLSKLTCTSDITPTAGDTFDLTVRKEGADTSPAMTCQLNNGNGGECSDLVNTNVAAVGDRYSLKVVPAGAPISPTSGQIVCTVCWTAN